MEAVERIILREAYLGKHKTSTVINGKQPANPRETMGCFPDILQSYITRLTGKPLSKEVYSFKSLSPLHHLITSCFTLIGGILGSAALVRCDFPLIFLLPLAWLLTVHGARKIKNLILHQCINNNFFRIKFLNRLFGKLMSILLVFEEFDKSKEFHTENYKNSVYRTIDDPAVACLLNVIGLKPGAKVNRMWKKLLGKIFNPFYHVRFFLARLLSHFIKTSILHKSAFLIYLTGLASLIVSYNLYLEFLFGLLIPLTVLYQISSTIRFTGKYIFPKKLVQGEDHEPDRLFMLGVFTGINCPSNDLPLWKSPFFWLEWIAEMLIFHIPMRLFILPGDSCVHDYHRRNQREPDWFNYLHNREADIAFAKACNKPYFEVWGIHQAINECFKSLSEANAADYSKIKKSFKDKGILAIEN